MTHAPDLHRRALAADFKYEGNGTLVRHDDVFETQISREDDDSQTGLATWRVQIINWEDDEPSSARFLVDDHGHVIEALEGIDADTAQVLTTDLR